jgi:ASC-1-like (ASCH) protein
MEVHHHPDTHHKRKKFKEYFLEFLMLFLAVTMGFFAENIREHFSDKEKEKQYLRSFIEDLSLDEQRLPVLISSIERQQIRPGDTLPDLLNHVSIKTPANVIYYSFRSMLRQQSIKVYITDRTIEQAKNAGEIRLITDKQTSDSLIEYYKRVDYAASLQEILLSIKRELAQHYRPLLNGHDFAKVIDNSDHIIYPKDTLYLRSVDENTINDCLISISEVKGLSITIRNSITEIMCKAENIKKMIKDRYNLKN